MSEQGQVSQPLRVGRKVSHTPFPDTRGTDET